MQCRLQDLLGGELHARRVWCAVDAANRRYVPVLRSQEEQRCLVQEKPWAEPVFFLALALGLRRPLVRSRLATQKRHSIPDHISPTRDGSRRTYRRVVQ